MREHNFLQKKAVKHPRIAGALILTIGLYFTCTSVIEPYRKIIHDDPHVAISIIGTIMGIFLPIIGTVFICFGNKYANEIFMSPSDLPKAQRMTFYLVLAIVTFSAFFLFVGWLSKHGYKLL